MSYPTKLVKLISPIALAIALSACGGGSEFGSKSEDSGTTDSGTTDGGSAVEVVSALDLKASSRQLFSDGAVPIIITATAKNENNVEIPDAEMEFAVDNGGSLKLDTENNGLATLTPGSKEIRSLNVSVTSGDISQTLVVDVIGSYVSITGDSSIALNSPSEYTFKLRDAADDPITFTQVTLNTDLGSFSPSSGTTNATGEFVSELTSTVGGTATISASALGASAEQTVNISGDVLTLTGTDLNQDGEINLEDRELELGQNEQLTVKWLLNGVAQVGKTISIRNDRGTIDKQSLVTDANGEGTFIISPENQAAVATFTVETAEGLTAEIEREFIATTPEDMSIQASPPIIAPNTSSTILVRVWDEYDNAVKNQTISFSLTDTVYGTISESEATTDSSGRAEIVYTAGDVSSSIEAITIEAELVDFPAINNEVNLTVGSNASSITLGTTSLIEADGVFYVRPFGVTVNDSAGQPVANQEVHFSIAATHYKKGYMLANEDTWYAVYTTSCRTEDMNFNNKLDDGEDVNGNGILTPNRPATITGSGTTDEDGKLTVYVTYLKSEALWSEQRITASITKVTGTEVVAHTTHLLGALADDMTQIDGPPPNATYYREDRNENTSIDTGLNEDVNGNLVLDIGEDIYLNNQIDTSYSEDLDDNGQLDVRWKGAYGYANQCINPN